MPSFTFNWGKHPLLCFFKAIAMEVVADDCMGLASEMAFSLMVSMVPGIICIVSLAALFGQTHQLLPVWQDWIDQLAPTQSITLLKSVVTAVLAGGSKGMAIFSFLGSLIPASNAAQVFIKALLRSAKLQEIQHRFYYQPLFGIVMVVCLGTLMFGASNLILFGSALTHHLYKAYHLNTQTVILVNTLKWTLLTMSVTFLTALIFMMVHFTNGLKMHWPSAFMGAGVFVGVWIVISWGFGFYIHNFNRFNPVYGSLWGVVLLMTWLYLSSLSLLIGGEVAALLGHSRQEWEQAGLAK